MLEDPYAYVEAALQAPPSLDYMPGPEELEQAPPSPDFVPEPIYREFMPPEDDHPKKDDKDPEEDPEEDPDDYSTDKDDDDDEEEEEEESSKDDADDKEEDEDKDKDEEEEEYLALADSIPPPACCTTARMSIRDQTPIPFSYAAKIDRFLAISTSPPSPLTSYSSPLPQIPSPPLPVSSPLPIPSPPLPATPTHPLGYRAAMTRLRAESSSTSHQLPLPLPIILPHTRASMAMMRAAAPSTYIVASRSETSPLGTPPLLPIPLPTSSPPLLLPSTDYRVYVLEVTLPHQKRLCIILGPRHEVEESSSAPTARPTGGFRADYGFVGTLDAEIRHDPDREICYKITDVWEDPDEIAEEIPTTDVVELGQRMTYFVTTVRHDTDEIYERLDDAQDDRSLMSGQLNLLRRDRRSHTRTARLMESESKASCKAWVQFMDANDTTRSKTQMAALQSQQRLIGDPTHHDVPEKADSSS
ncbi:hypothetical protein Tco_1514344, partial [Tanacetum coccineum]